MAQRKITFKDLREQFKKSAYYNRPNDFGVDGEDHINIWINGETKLGRILDPVYLKTINYNYIGKFASVQNLWFWLRTPSMDDSIRRMNARALRAYIQSQGIRFRHVPNFKAIIGSATWYKVKGYWHIIKELKNLDPSIKFLSYYTMKSSGLRVATSYSAMMIEIADIIRDAVQKGVEPDFTPLCDVPSKTRLRYLEAFLENILPHERFVELLAKEESGDSGLEAEEEAEEYELPAEEEPAAEEETAD